MLKHETDAARQKEYRRGYKDGVAAMISALVDKLEYEEKEKIDAWFTRELTPLVPSHWQIPSPRPATPRIAHAPRAVSSTLVLQHETCTCDLDAARCWVGVSDGCDDGLQPGVDGGRVEVH